MLHPSYSLINQVANRLYFIMNKHYHGNMLTIPKWRMGERGQIFIMFCLCRTSCFGYLNLHGYRDTATEVKSRVGVLCLKSAFISMMKAHLSSDSNNSLCPLLVQLATDHQHITRSCMNETRDNCMVMQYSGLY